MRQPVLAHAVLRPTDEWRGSKEAIIGCLEGEIEKWQRRKLQYVI